MAQSHFWCGPKSNHEPEQERVAHEAIEKAFLENQICILLALLKQIDLPESEKIKVIDHKSAGQHEQPAGPKEGRQHETANRVRYVPDHTQNRTPLPEEQQQK